MLGGIVGDIIGSSREAQNDRSYGFELFVPESDFTDDSVLMIATADAILRGRSLVENYKRFYADYPFAGYGGNFITWARSTSDKPYNSYGNGSAMRVPPVGWAYDDLPTVLEKAEESAAVTHNHPEGIKGAKAIAGAVFIARTTLSKVRIREFITRMIGYDLNDTVENLRSWYRFDVSCQGSVPQAIIAFLESSDFENAIRKAVNIGGDSDTIACMTGAIAEAYYGGVPGHIAQKAWNILPVELAEIVDQFRKRYVRHLRTA